MNPLVSILVPIYNVQSYIEHCARSLFEQTYDNVEYIFVNDCSPDRSVYVLESVINEYPNRKDFAFIVSHDKNRGLAASRLTGIEKASGEYLMFVDSDDYLELDAVELLVDSALNNKSDIATAGIRHLFADKSYALMPPSEISKESYLKMILEGAVSHNTVSRLFKKCLFEGNNNLFVEGINSGEDYLMISRIFYNAKIISFVYQPLYNYIHTNPNSFTNSFKRCNFEQITQAEAIVRRFYEGKKENEYLKSQIIGCLKGKAQNLILLLLNDYNVADYQDVVNIYKEDEYKLLSRVPFQYRIVLWLTHLFNDKGIAIFVRAGFKAKNIYKKFIH